MAVFFLFIIYMAFISLGLPDPLLGVAWPMMRVEFGMPLEAAGPVSMFLAGGMILSGLASGVVVKRLGTGKVVFFSCVMTAASLLGFSLSSSYVWLLFLAIPLGLGAGSVDAGLNNYVATHYKAHHMSWLHCCWGVGATIGPMIMSWYMGGGKSWRSGYLTVSLIQFALAVLLFSTLPLWKRMEQKAADGAANPEEGEPVPGTESAGEKAKSARPIRVKGVKLALLCFAFYCGAEGVMGLWGSSYLVNVRGLTAATAAQWVSAYFSGIMAGRFISGFITLKLTNRVLIRLGQLLSLAGALLLLLPLPAVFSLAGFVLIGLGFAPVFPCMVHETPARFGKANSPTIIGFQMASAYAGGTFLPPVLGLVASHTNIGILPLFVILFIVIILICSESINRFISGRSSD